MKIEDAIAALLKPTLEHSADDLARLLTQAFDAAEKIGGKPMTEARQALAMQRRH